MSSRSPSESAPELDFDWEEDLFVVFRNVVRWLKPKSKTRAGSVSLVDHQDSFTALARVVGSRPLRVVASRKAGGLRSDDILLPQVIDWALDTAQNLNIVRVRVALAAELSKQLVGCQIPSDDPRRAAWILPHIVIARDALMAEFENFEAQWKQAAHVALEHLGESEFDIAVRAILEQTPLPKELATPVKKYKIPILWGRLLAVNIAAELTNSQTMPERREREIGTEHDAPSPENVEIVDLDPKKKQDLPVHVFEKVETAEEFNGTVKTPDGEDELDDQLEALEALNLEHMFRGGEEAGSVYKTDVRLELDIPDVSLIRPGEEGIPYDEWDHRKRRYREGWSTVYPTTIGCSGTSWAAEKALEHRGMIAQLVRHMQAKRHRLRPHNRQLYGEDIDLEAVVSELSAIQAGHGGNPRLYSKRIRSQRSVATTVLVDLSLSSDSWVGDQRVLDVALEALVVLGETTHILGDSLQVLGFASQTRNQVRVWEIKSWKESWLKARQRLGALEPQGYTRIGPALRHACAEVGKTSAQRKLVLMLSDGKPTDYDKYEGRYGIEDVRQAVREGAAQGVHMHALAIDETARDYLPQMLGANHWSLLPHPRELVLSLSEIYGRLT